MHNQINKAVIRDLALHKAAFETAKPFKHVVINDFLDSAFAEALLANFPSVDDPSKLLSEYGTPNPKSARSDVRALAAPFLQMDNYIQTPAFLEMLTEITGIPDLCYDPHYYGAGTHENFHGAGLDAHYDFNIHPDTGYHRRLNAIIYLNKDWNPEWRGDISFHTDPWDLKNDVKTSVYPTFYRCVIFETTENSWHSVGAVKLPENLRHLSRKSFTIYLYTRTRPVSELAVEHGTIYVPPPLPVEIREGLVIDKDTAVEINNNIVRRHQYLRSLYNREYKFSEYIENLKGQIRDLKARQYIPILGNAKLLNVSKPLQPDGWMEEELCFSIQLRSPARQFELSMWRPDGGTEPFRIGFTVGDSHKEKSFRGGLENIVLDSDFSKDDTVNIRIVSDKTRIAGAEDSRLLSIVIESITIR